MLLTVHTTIFWHNTFGNVYRHVEAAFADLHIIEEWTSGLGGNMHVLSALLVFIDAHVNIQGYVQYVVYHKGKLYGCSDCKHVQYILLQYLSWLHCITAMIQTNWISKSIRQLQDHKWHTPPAQILHKNNIVRVTAHHGGQLLYLCRYICDVTVFKIQKIK